VTGPAIAAVALVVTAVATPVVIVVARRTGIVDRPGELKPQSDPIPYLGGVAVFLGMTVGVAVGRPTVLVPLGGALALGVADDRFDLPPLIRLVGQVAIGLTVVVTCPLHLPGAVAVLAVPVVAVVVINGVNLIDGLDMLAAGVVGVAAAGFAVVLHGAGRQMAVATAAALVAFLAYNRRRGVVPPRCGADGAAGRGLGAGRRGPGRGGRPDPGGRTGRGGRLRRHPTAPGPHPADGRRPGPPL
jgi:UDP-GlcNAc:undecaprenyl-phosphate GlcNAc-1-phosphate transferase